MHAASVSTASTTIATSCSRVWAGGAPPPLAPHPTHPDKQACQAGCIHVSLDRNYRTFVALVSSLTLWTALLIILDIVAVAVPAVDRCPWARSPIR